MTANMTVFMPPQGQFTKAELERIDRFDEALHRMIAQNFTISRRMGWSARIIGNSRFIVFRTIQDNRFRFRGYIGSRPLQANAIGNLGMTRAESCTLLPEPAAHLYVMVDNRDGRFGNLQRRDGPPRRSLRQKVDWPQPGVGLVSHD